MPHPYWPLFDLIVRTPSLELRHPTDEIATELATVAAEGIHDPAFMPFLVPWTRQHPPALQPAVLKHLWSLRAAWTPEKWSFTAAVIVDGRAVGVQAMHAERFAVTRTVTTASWLGRTYQGQGLGREMRAAILHLAFAGLGAAEAYSGAFADNAPSLRLSESLGYEDNGGYVHDREGVAARVVNLKLTRERWEQHRRDDIELLGLERCAAWFGALNPAAPR